MEWDDGSLQLSPYALEFLYRNAWDHGYEIHPEEFDPYALYDIEYIYQINQYFLQQERMMRPQGHWNMPQPYYPQQETQRSSINPYLVGTAFVALLAAGIYLTPKEVVVGYRGSHDCGRIGGNYPASVLRWEADAMRWCQQVEIDSGLITAIIRAETNGYHDAVSKTGVTCLFQVMGSNFRPGESPANVEDCARAGLRVLMAELDATGGRLGPAAAGYNGGPMAREWMLGNISRNDYITFLMNQLGWDYQTSSNKAHEVELYVERVTSFYKEAKPDWKTHGFMTNLENFINTIIYKLKQGNN